MEAGATQQPGTIVHADSSNVKPASSSRPSSGKSSSSRPSSARKISSKPTSGVGTRNSTALSKSSGPSPRKPNSRGQSASQKSRKTSSRSNTPRSPKPSITPPPKTDDASTGDDAPMQAVEPSTSAATLASEAPDNGLDTESHEKDALGTEALGTEGVVADSSQTALTTEATENNSESTMEQDNQIAASSIDQPPQPPQEEVVGDAAEQVEVADEIDQPPQPPQEEVVGDAAEQAEGADEIAAADGEIDKAKDLTPVPVEAAIEEGSLGYDVENIHKADSPPKVERDNAHDEGEGEGQGEQEATVVPPVDINERNVPGLSIGGDDTSGEGPGEDEEEDDDLTKPKQNSTSGEDSIIRELRRPLSMDESLNSHRNPAVTTADATLQVTRTLSI